MGGIETSTPAVVRFEWAWVGIVLLSVAVATRMAVYGNPHVFVDEAFYFAAGVEMQHGAVPFVDIWDRKPAGHFLLFAAFAWVSSNPLSYQLAATAFAFVTAATIYVAARRPVGRLGALLGACTYLFALCVFRGDGGQSAVFYNTFVALAGTLLLDRRGSAFSQRRIVTAMFLVGIALTIKTTVLFEAFYFGGACIVMAMLQEASNRPTIARIATWVLAGALPSLAIAAWYAAHGYWDEYWTAMVTSNLRKEAATVGSLHRLALLTAIALPLFAAALGGLARWPRGQRYFLGGWILAAPIGFFSVPAFYLHYALPLLVPLCLAAAGLFGRPTLGPACFGLLAAASFVAFPYLDFDRTRESGRSMAALVEAVGQHGKDGPLLVYDGPPLLYTLAHKRFATPLTFPNHLNDAAERDVSHIQTTPEVRRILANRPDMVVIKAQRASNRETAALVARYIAANCRKIASVTVPAGALVRVEAFGDCRAGANKKPRR